MLTRDKPLRFARSPEYNEPCFSEIHASYLIVPSNPIRQHWWEIESKCIHPKKPSNLARIYVILSLYRIRTYWKSSSTKWPTIREFMAEKKSFIALLNPYASGECSRKQAPVNESKSFEYWEGNPSCWIWLHWRTAVRSRGSHQEMQRMANRSRIIKSRAG